MKERIGQTRLIGKKLKYQLMMVFVVTITLLMALVSLLTYHRSEIIIREQSSRLMQQQFQQNAYYITSQIDEINKVLRLLMIQESMQNYMREGWQDDFWSLEQIWSIFEYSNMMMRNYDGIDSIYYFSSDGTALGLTERRQMVRHEKDPTLPWYQLKIQERIEGHQGEIFWFGGYTNRDFSITELSPDEETPAYLTAACAVWLTNSKYVTVVVNIHQKEIADIFSLPNTSVEERQNYLIDGSGTIVAHPDEEMVGKKTDLTPEELKASQENYIMRDNVQINYYQMSETGWTIIKEIPEKELYGSLVSLKWWFVWLTAGGFLLALLLYAYSLNRLTDPLTRLRAAMERMEQGYLGEQLDEDSRNELGMLGRQFNHMSRSIDTMVHQIREMEQEKASLEKEVLQAQLNPHFLFNTLSNMRFMAKLGQVQMLEDCFGAMGRMLQPLYRSEGALWTLYEELDYMSNYLVIMNIRYNGKLDMEFEISEELLDCQVLKFILQPLVENSIEHGFEETKEECMIILGAEKEDGCLKLYVEDNGCGMTEEQQEILQEQLRKAETEKELYKNHVGVVNVHRRLRVHFGDEYGLHVESVRGEGTCIWLKMPFVR